MKRMLTFLMLALVTGAFAATAAPDPAPGIRLVSYNIKHGRGMDGRVDLRRIAGVIKTLKPDLVAVQEVDKDCTRSGNVDIAAELGRLLEMEHRFGKFMDLQGGEYGLAVLSRFPITRSFRHQLPDGAEPRCALEVIVEPPGMGTPLSFVCIHNDWTREDLRVAQVEALVEALKPREHPVVLAGDFNARRGAQSMKILEEAGWRLDRKNGAATFPSDKPRVEIDFFMTRNLPGAEGLTARVHDERVASDHRPIHAVLEPPKTRREYERQTMNGWTVHVERALLEEHAELAREAVATLDQKLEEASRVVPEDKLPYLRAVPIWVSLDNGKGAAHHPSRQWLVDHGKNPEMAGAVEIKNARNFVQWIEHQPMMVVHELAHAYHHGHLGHGAEEVRSAYRQARDSGLYDEVPYWSGKVKKAYAMNNHKEYFAELTEAYFGENDFYPFTRDELAEHDPVGYRMIESVWLGAPPP